MVKLNELPEDSLELEDWLWDYMTGKVTQPMVEKLAMQLERVIDGGTTSEFGREAAEKIQALSAADFSAWVVAHYA